jgi:hypothetical protein
VTARCSTPDVGGSDKPKKKDRKRSDSKSNDNQNGSQSNAPKPEQFAPPRSFIHTFPNFLSFHSTSPTLPITYTITNRVDIRVQNANGTIPLGNQVAKRVLAEAEQSERALEQIFGELLV